MSLSPRGVLGLLAWGAAIWGVLRLGELPGNWGSICGPWGCGPPVQALAACHLFWVVLLGAPAAWAVCRLRGGTLWWLGLALVVVGTLGLVVIGFWESATWLAHAGEFQRPYLIQHVLFAVATLVDVPLVPLAGVGIVCLVASRRHRNKEELPSWPLAPDPDRDL